MPMPTPMRTPGRTPTPTPAAVGAALVAVGGLARTALPADHALHDATWDDAVSAYVEALAGVLRRGGASLSRVRGLMSAAARPIVPCVLRCAAADAAAAPPVMFLPGRGDTPADVARAVAAGDADLAIVAGLGVGAGGGVGHYLPIYVDTRRRVLHTADPYGGGGDDALGAWALRVVQTCLASMGVAHVPPRLRVRVGRGVRQDGAALTCGPWAAWLLTAWALDAGGVRRDVGAPLFGDDRGVLRFWRAVTRLAD